MTRGPRRSWKHTPANSGDNGDSGDRGDSGDSGDSGDDVWLHASPSACAFTPSIARPRPRPRRRPRPRQRRNKGTDVLLTSEEARQQAQVEKLTLLVADNSSGYFGVVHLANQAD